MSGRQTRVERTTVGRGARRGREDERQSWQELGAGVCIQKHSDAGAGGWAGQCGATRHACAVADLVGIARRQRQQVWEAREGREKGTQQGHELLAHNTHN